MKVNDFACLLFGFQIKNHLLRKTQSTAIVSIYSSCKLDLNIVVRCCCRVEITSNLITRNKKAHRDVSERRAGDDEEIYIKIPLKTLQQLKKARKFQILLHAMLS